MATTVTCGRCGLVVAAKAGDEIGPIVRMQLHWAMEHPPTVKARKKPRRRRRGGDRPMAGWRQHQW